MVERPDFSESVATARAAFNARGLGFPPAEISVGQTETTPGKAEALRVVALMQRAQEGLPPGDPIGAYRAPDAPDHYVREVPEYLLDRFAPETLEGATWVK